jgi:predicted RNA-binding Zn ribbon-like protein
MVRIVPYVPDAPFESGAPYWYWLGGRPAVDFVNTLRERWRRRVECLVTPSDLAMWLTEATLLDEPAPVSPNSFRRALALREAIDEAIVTTVNEEPIPTAAIDEIDGWLRHARSGYRLERISGAPVLREDQEPAPILRALGFVALDAAKIFGTSQRTRVGICAAADCSTRFYDRSPTGDRRRWCTMRICGNNAKARRHRQRVAKR